MKSRWNQNYVVSIGKCTHKHVTHMASNTSFTYGIQQYVPVLVCGAFYTDFATTGNDLSTETEATSSTGKL